MADDELFDEKTMKKVLDAELPSAKTMVNTIYNELEMPKSFLDIGCGPGHFSNEIKRLGKNSVCVTAIDISKQAKKFIEPNINFIQYDLRMHLDLSKKFDVVLCLEVIEHIEEEYENILCESIVRHVGKYLIITVAQPNQRALGHVNLKSLKYWIRKFESFGLIYKNDLSEKWAYNWFTDGDVQFYFYNNILVFTKEGEDINY